MMKERILSSFDWFVTPFMFGLIFVLTYCIIGLLKVIYQLPAKDRLKLAISLITPPTIVKNIKDLFFDCLFHVKLWKRNKMLGYMHSSIAFGWFMLIVLGHLETWFYIPERLHLSYYPIFFRFFMQTEGKTLQGTVFFFLMDFFLLVVMSGIAIAIIKRFRSRIVGMRRTTRLTFLDHIALYSLWAIFPLRWIAEGFTAGVAGGSFMTIPINLMLSSFMSNPENIKLAWWAYSCALGIFMTALPFTRYMHIPTEILLIPMKNAGLKVRRSNKGFALAQLYTCPSCGVCLDACPMAQDKAHLKDATVYMVRQYKRHNKRRSTQIAEKCLMCGKCGALCPISITATDLRLAFREEGEVRSNLHQNFNFLPFVDGVSDCEGKVLYYAGCMSSLTPVIAPSVAKVLDAAGVDWAPMDKDGTICCGRPLLLAGKRDEAAKLIEKNTAIIKASGAKVLLVSCAICYRIFREEYNLEGVKVVHYTEYFNSLIKAGKLKVDKGLTKYVYHDPCDLGRGCGIYDAPREAVSAVGTLVPAKKEKKESICCGGSVGSLTLTYDDRKRITKRSIDNLLENDPDKIVTACPLCLKTYSDQSKVPVEDFAQMIAGALSANKKKQ